MLVSFSLIFIEMYKLKFKVVCKLVKLKTKKLNI